MTRGMLLASGMPAAVCSVSQSSTGSLCLFVDLSFTLAQLFRKSENRPIKHGNPNIPRYISRQVSPIDRGAQVRQGEREGDGILPIVSPCPAPGLTSAPPPPPAPGNPAQIINEQQRACGYMFCAALELPSDHNVMGSTAQWR